MHDAFATALDAWSQGGVPRNPRSWLISTGRFKGIDALRRRSRSEKSLTELLARAELDQHPAGERDDDELEDDRLRLIFTCCHPALSPDAQIALTLREVCGLTTEEIAHAYFTKPSAVAQRIVRAKRTLSQAQVPFEVPSTRNGDAAMKARPTSVMWHTIVSPTGREKTGYPTQKPLKVIERIVRVHSRAGDRLLDFFAGSGTFGEAAVRLGRQVTLIDHNPEAIEVMRRRLDFAAPVVFEPAAP